MSKMVEKKQVFVLPWHEIQLTMIWGTVLYILLAVFNLV